MNLIFNVSENVIIYFDVSTKNFLSNIDNKEGIYDKEMVHHHFKMTNTNLTCTDCNVEEDEKNIEI